MIKKGGFSYTKYLKKWPPGECFKYFMYFDCTVLTKITILLCIAPNTIAKCSVSPLETADKQLRLLQLMSTVCEH